MKKQFSKKNGFYKYYNSEGKVCRIKISDKIKCQENFECLISFWHANDAEWKMHSPSKVFKDIFEVINFILKNLENDRVVFKIH